MRSTKVESEQGVAHTTGHPSASYWRLFGIGLLGAALLTATAGCDRRDPDQPGNPLPPQKPPTPKTDSRDLHTPLQLAQFAIAPR